MEGFFFLMQNFFFAPYFGNGASTPRSTMHSPPTLGGGWVMSCVCIIARLTHPPTTQIFWVKKNSFLQKLQVTPPPPPPPIMKDLLFWLLRDLLPSYRLSQQGCGEQGSRMTSALAHEIMAVWFLSCLRALCSSANFVDSVAHVGYRRSLSFLTMALHHS